MRKPLIKIASLMLALLMISAALVSCAGENKTPDETQGQETQAPDSTWREVHPEITQKNYDTEFYISVVPDSNRVELYWVQESQNNTMSDAVYNRQERIKKYLGMEMFAKTTDGENRYVAPFQNAIKNKDDSVHLLLSHVFYGIDGFITGNYLTDYNDIPEINLDADYWNYDVMEAISVKDRM